MWILALVVFALLVFANPQRLGGEADHFQRYVPSVRKALDTIDRLPGLAASSVAALDPQGPTIRVGFPIENDAERMACNTTPFASVVSVRTDNVDQLFVGGLRAARGTWCILASNDASQRVVESCNLNTSYVVVGIDGSSNCVSRVPRIFGGPFGNDVVACSNERINFTSALWDFRDNTAVTAHTHDITDENEMLEGTRLYRFRCKWPKASGVVEHPLDRLQPMIDPCTRYMDNPHATVRMRVTLGSDNTLSWKCDCGDFAVTRVRNARDDDDKTPCTTCILTKRDDGTPRPDWISLRIPYICASVASPIIVLSSQIPCLLSKEELAAGRNKRCDHFELELWGGSIWGVHRDLFIPPRTVVTPASGSKCRRDRDIFVAV